MRNNYRFSGTCISHEILEGLVRLSHDHCIPIGLVCSTGQCGDNAYTGFTRERLQSTLALLHSQFSCADVFWTRDHLGKDNFELDKILDYADADVAAGAVGIHLHTDDPVAAKMAMTARPTYGWEIGPGEDSSRDWQSLFTNLEPQPNLMWLSFPTGMLITEIQNSNTINYAACDFARMHANRLHTKLKGHNSDYAVASVKQVLRSLVDSIQVAPQFGVLQSSIYIRHAILHGFDISNWIAACEKFFKWTTDPHKMLLCNGHYFFHCVPDRLRELAHADVVENVYALAKSYCFSD